MDSPKTPNNKTVPALPLRDIIIFPHMVVPLFVGREKSIAALDQAMQEEKDILLVTQINAKTNDPKPEDIYKTGCLGTIVQLLRLPDGTVKVLVEGTKRARVKNYTETDPFFVAEVEEINEDNHATVEVEALMRSVKNTFETYVKLNKRIPPEMLSSVSVIDDPARLSDTIVAHLNLKIPDKQSILEIIVPKERLEKLLELMHGEIEILQVEKKIRTRVKKQMEKTQKEYYLNEQMAAIQKELGERDEFNNEIQEIEAKMKKKKLSKEASDRLKKEIKKLKMMSPMSAEATVVRNYIDWILALPWGEKTKDNMDVHHAQTVLDADHYGLKKTKERILEYLAVQRLVGKIKGPILCLVGPPGVGKTSLGRSIAKACGRNFVRISLGGVRDEAEIRGHRRTYIGAMPGKMIQSLKKADSNNPVFLMDEIDKMSNDSRGDPSSALLEVLDPEQNITFNDHYLDLDYDLSDIMFIATANSLAGIPGPLMDRMEIIRIAGYTEDEKLAIATKYLIPKQMEQNGLKEDDITFSESAIRSVIRLYTKEAGVRNLEREMANVCRKVARSIAELKEGQERKKSHISAKNIHNYLGVQKFRYGLAEENDEIGITTGLAWTEVGGEILQTEVTIMPGKGKVTITGKLGDVMQESVQAAMSAVRSRAPKMGLKPDFFEKIDFHVHVPEGAIPKDGPSAGITMATSITSALTRIPVKKDVAMTGEITLRGKVLPIGGLKEKLLAAMRAGIKTVMIPQDNEKDLKEVPNNVKKALKIYPVSMLEEVLERALCIDTIKDLYKHEDDSSDLLDIYVDAKPLVEEIKEKTKRQPRH